MNDEFDGERIGFEVDGERLTVHDTIEGERMRFRVDREPDLSPALTALFPFPVDRAVSFEAERIDIPEYASVIVRDVDGDHVARLNEPMEFSRGSYCIEVNGETKATLRVTDVEIHASGAAGPDPITLSFDRPRTVSIGGRSLHTRPEATVTVPDDPVALAEAVSVLGSSIKEFTPERSWPTLRGYPPRIERGDSLDIPSPLTAPETGVEVVVRPTYEDVYRLSTLSYYLGARMTIGDAPAIRLDTGYKERLPTEGRALEERVTELFKTWFFLDTLARTEGYVPSDRYEYEQIGPELPFYPPNLADRSMSERLMEYLQVDPESVAPYAPAWATQAVLRPTPDAAELLPHLAHVLAPVRVRGASEPTRPNAPVALATSPQAPVESSESGPTTNWVPTPDADPIPPNVSVITPAAYENRLERGIASRGEVSVAFLFDDPDRAYSVREFLTDATVPDGIGSWSVSLRPGPEVTLEALSDPSLDIVFCGLSVYERHAEAADPAEHAVTDGEGAPTLSVFESAGGLPAAVSAVDRGSTSGVVLDDAARSDRIRTFIGLLATGAPIAVAASLAFDGKGVNVRFVGDPLTNVATDRGAPLQLYSCSAVSSDSFQISLQSYLSTDALPGEETRLVIECLDSKNSLVGAPEREVGQVDISGIPSLYAEKAPILRLSDDFVFWSDDLSAEDIETFARRALSETSEPESHAESDCRN